MMRYYRNSTTGHVFITASNPLSFALLHASSSITPSCNQTALAFIRIASSTTPPARLLLTNISTTSISIPDAITSSYHKY